MIEIQKIENKKKFSEMLKKVSFKFPVAEISSSTGYSKGSVSEILKENRSPTDEFLKKFSEAYKINLDDYKDIESDGESKKETFDKKLESKHGIPYYDVDFTASFLSVENNNQVEPTSYISHPFFKGCDYVVRASGQSMANHKSTKMLENHYAIGESERQFE